MEEKKRRTAKAKEAFCKAAEEHGVEVCSWEEMPSYNKFINGELTEDQLSEQARQEMAQIAQTFNKYMIKKEEVPPVEDPEEMKRKRARDANRIYKQACLDSGKSRCFFNSFSTWHEFVEGRIGDEQLYEKAIEEVRRRAENPQG